MPNGADATIRTLAERMVLKHHSVVELVDRLASHGYVRRMRSSEDRRKVLVSLLPRGVKLVEKVARDRISELRSSGVKLVTAIDALLQPKSQERLQSTAGSRVANFRDKKSRPVKKGKSSGK